MKVANLVEQARAWNGTGSALDTAELLIDLADALEAAEDDCASWKAMHNDACRERDAAQRAEKHVARAMRDVMAERDALADALLEIRDHDPKTCRVLSDPDPDRPPPGASPFPKPQMQKRP